MSKSTTIDKHSHQLKRQYIQGEIFFMVEIRQQSNEPKGMHFMMQQWFYKKRFRNHIKMTVGIITDHGQTPMVKTFKYITDSVTKGN